VSIWSCGGHPEQLLNGERFVYDLPGPIWIHVGRVAPERNIEQFLQLDLPGSKVIIGDGADRARLQRIYPDCHFLGYKFGDDLRAHLSAADVFVFPGRTDTFGLIVLEAIAGGLPIAALPLQSPLDLVRCGLTGVLDNDLQRACLEALQLDRDTCRKRATDSSWQHSTEQLVATLGAAGRR